jgi:hypothetical protein
MRSETYPLALPPELLGEVRKTAADTGLSMADAMRASLRLGLPKLREHFQVQPGLKPMTKAECKALFGPDPEFDALFSRIVKEPAPKPEDD